MYSTACKFSFSVSSKKIPNEKYGCPDLNPLIRSYWKFQLCNVETNQACTEPKICCPTEFGSSCKVPTYIKPSPIAGCPPINTDIVCVWYNETCNNIDNPCPAGSVCCGDNCGTWCVEQKKQCGCKPKPVKRCPPVDTSIQCIRFDEQCNDTDKRCPLGSSCCGSSCGTVCIKQ